MNYSSTRYAHFPAHTTYPCVSVCVWWYISRCQRKLCKNHFPSSSFLALQIDSPIFFSETKSGCNLFSLRFYHQNKSNAYICNEGSNFSLLPLCNTYAVSCDPWEGAKVSIEVIVFRFGFLFFPFKAKLLKSKPRIGFTLNIGMSSYERDTLPGSLSPEIETVIWFSVLFWLASSFRRIESEKNYWNYKTVCGLLDVLWFQPHKTFRIQQPPIFW